MRIYDLYTMEVPRNRHDRETLQSSVFDEHVDALKKAYEASGIDVNKSEQMCPGMRTEEGEFQAHLWLSAEDLPIGTHFLATNPDETIVREADTFPWKGVLDATAGRARERGSKLTADFKLTDGVVRTVTRFIEMQTAAGLFVPMRERQVLSVSA